MSIQLSALILVVSAGFIVVAHRQRAELLEAHLGEETERVAEVLLVGAQYLLREGRVRQLDAVLRMALRADKVFAAFVWTESGLLAGSADDLPCLVDSLPRPLPGQQQTGRADCGVGVRWAVSPVGNTGANLVVGLEETFVRSALAAGLRRELLFAAIATMLAASAVSIVLYRSIVLPLRVLDRGVRDMAADDSVLTLRLGNAPREVSTVVAALNDTAAQQAARRAALIARSEEQLALERRLAQAEKFAMIGRLSGGLAHELGSPLSVIGIRAQVIEERSNDVPAVRDEAVAISREVGRMTSFIEGLLHLSSKHGLVLGDVDIHEVASEVLDDLEARARDADVVMRLERAEGEAVVPGQATMLRHALHNVVRNALHALTHHAGEKRVIIRVLADEREVRIIVDDSGPGIPADELDKVFQPFHTTRASGKGVGLGLPVSRGIVDEHGGHMDVDRGPEGGARVTITLPRGGPPRRETAGPLE